MKRTFELYMVGAQSDTRVAIVPVTVEIGEPTGPTLNRETILNAIERAMPGLEVNGGRVHHVRTIPEEEAALADADVEA